MVTRPRRRVLAGDAVVSLRHGGIGGCLDAARARVPGRLAAPGRLRAADATMRCRCSTATTTSPLARRRAARTWWRRRRTQLRWRPRSGCCAPRASVTPRALTVIGGVHPTHMADEVLGRPRGGLRGARRGRAHVARAARVPERRGGPGKVPGVSFRSGWPASRGTRRRPPRGRDRAAHARPAAGGQPGRAARGLGPDRLAHLSLPHQAWVSPGRSPAGRGAAPWAAASARSGSCGAARGGRAILRLWWPKCAC